MEIRGKNEYTHIILKYDEKKDTYEDVTNKVIFIKDNFSSWYVVFDNNKSYHCGFNKIRIGADPQEISIFNKTVYINNVPTKVYKILYFDKIGYKIFSSFNNSFFVENITIQDEKIIIDNLNRYIYKTSNKVFNYYKSLAHYASEMDSSDDSIEKIIFNLYKKIDRVNTDSALYSYTHQVYRKKEYGCDKLIFPFSTNASQIKAVKAVFENNVSIISGPPGTGKTQVILNLISNSLIQNKKIAVISNNNTAVENVYDKLEDAGYEFVLASLGSNNNVDNFFKKEDLLKEKIRTLTFENKKYDSSILPLLEKLYDEKNQLQQLKDDLFKLEMEYKHFINNNDNKKLVDYKIEFKNFTSYLELKNQLVFTKKITLFNKILLYLKFRVNVNKIQDLDNFIFFLDYKYYEFKIKWLTNRINVLENFLKKNNIHDLEDKLKENSKDIFNRYLMTKYINKKYPAFNADNYKDNYGDFIDRYPVTLSTTHSLLRNCIEGFMYDLVIVDEASQSDILTSLLTMNIARSVVVIGDEKQLSQIDNQNIYDISEKLASIYNIDSSYKYKDNSILKSISSLDNKPVEVLLREHYRCDLRIIKFCNEKFYNGDLIICTNTSYSDPLEVVYTVLGNHARKNPNGTGQYNIRECDEIINILKILDSDNVGIITPFKAQAEYISKMIKDDYPNVEVDTIHKYQGRQKDIIILSTVVNDLKDANEDFITNFVTNSQLLNVAISRAVKKIYLVVSHGVYNSKKNNIAQFIEYIKYYCNNSVNEGKVVSIFDCLYSDSYKTLKKQKFNKSLDSVAEEVLMSKLNDILKDYPEYKISVHVRLNDLINNYDNFTDKELRYIKHPWTHVDFVIFNKITYKPVLCIELDGTRYHDYSDKQTSHDNIKTKVLEQNNIPLLRIKTNESNEIDKIRNLL